MMRKKYLIEFVLIQNKIRQQKESITPKDLYIELIEWASNLSKTKDLQIQKLYFDYISYFEKINVNDHLLEPEWYNFDELIEIDFLKKSAVNLDNIVLTVRDILWEIIAFKTNRECKVLSVDNLRLLTNENRSDVFFCCDVCNYIENINEKRVESKGILYPATLRQIVEYNVHPAAY